MSIPGLGLRLGVGLAVLTLGCADRVPTFVDPTGQWEIQLPEGWSGGEPDPRMKQPLFRGPIGSFVIVYNHNPGPPSQLTPDVVMSYLETGLREGGGEIAELGRLRFEAAGEGQIAVYRVAGEAPSAPLPFIACIVFEHGIVQAVGAVDAVKDLEAVRDVLKTWRPLPSAGGAAK